MNEVIRRNSEYQESGAGPNNSMGTFRVYNSIPSSAEEIEMNDLAPSPRLSSAHQALIHAPHIFIRRPGARLSDGLEVS